MASLAETSPTAMGLMGYVPFSKHGLARWLSFRHAASSSVPEGHRPMNRLNLLCAHILVVTLTLCAFACSPTVARAIQGGTADPTNAMNQTVKVNGCSGTMVNNQWVLTANHCIGYTAVPASITVRLAIGTLYQQQTTATTIVRRPCHLPLRPQCEDAVLLRLSTPFQINGSTIGFARSQWPDTSASLNSAARTIRQIGFGGAFSQTFADLDPLRVTPNKRVARVSTGDIVDWNCNSMSLPCPSFGDSGGGGFIMLNGTTFQATIQAGVYGTGSNTPGFFALATSTPSIRAWLDENLYTAGDTIFSESVSKSGIAASTRGLNKIDLFWIDTSGNLKWKPFDSGWIPTTSLGKPSRVTLAGRPASVSWNSDRIDVFVRATNNTLWQKYFTGGAWVSDWVPIHGVSVASSPAVASWAENRLDVFVKGTDGKGSDIALWHLWYDGGWGDWESLGGSPLFPASAPAAVSWGYGRIDVFVQGPGNHVYHKWYDQSGQAEWQPGVEEAWENLGGTITGDPGVASWGPGRLDVFGRGPDGKMRHRWYDNIWLDSWINTGITHPNCEASAVSWGPGRVDVFSCSSGSIWQSYFPRP